MNCVFLSTTQGLRRKVLLKHSLYEHNIYQFLNVYSYCYRTHVPAPTDTVRTVKFFLADYSLTVLSIPMWCWQCYIGFNISYVVCLKSQYVQIWQSNRAQKCSYKKGFQKNSHQVQKTGKFIKRYQIGTVSFLYPKIVLSKL